MSETMMIQSYWLRRSLAQRKAGAMSVQPLPFQPSNSVIGKSEARYSLDARTPVSHWIAVTEDAGNKDRILPR